MKKAQPEQEKFEVNELESNLKPIATLQDEELIKLNSLLTKANNVTLKMQNINKDIENKSLLISNFEFRIKALKTEIGYQQEFIRSAGMQLKEAKLKYDKYVAELTDKYKLQPGWGFNEDTGEVIQAISNTP